MYLFLSYVTDKKKFHSSKYIVTDLLTLMISIVELARVKGAVGRATPSRTGAISESAVSHSSSTASLINAWKTLLHFTNG